MSAEQCCGGPVEEGVNLKVPETKKGGEKEEKPRKLSKRSKEIIARMERLEKLQMIDQKTWDLQFTI